MTVTPTAAGPLYAQVVVYLDVRRRTYAVAGMEADPDDEDDLTRVWDYLVPVALRSEIATGQLVWVPFGKRYLQGVVVALRPTSDYPGPFREIDQIVDAEPVLSPQLLDLAQWIAEAYLAPLHRVIQHMLPPGITQSTETVVALTEGASDGEITPTQAQIVGLLREHGPLVERQIGRLSGLSNWRPHVVNLARLGMVTRRVRIRPPAVSPKLEVVVRLAAGATTEQLSTRATRQRAVMDYLARRGARGQWVARSEIVAETGATTATITDLLEQGRLMQAEHRLWRDPLEGQSFVPVLPPILAPGQQEAWERIDQDLERPEGRPILLQGVTGSGKTEIYLQAVERVLAQGRGAIVLVPEIALTPQTVRRFGARFPDTIAVLHSGLTAGERYDQWQLISSGELRLVVGARSAVFSPVRDLGLIVLDEEHEGSYKQEVTPHYHTRDVAAHLARLWGATCLLGSATPALESAYRAERGEYLHLRLPQRILGHRRALEEQAESTHVADSRFHTEAGQPTEALYADLPPVEVVDMRAELRAGNTRIFSRVLDEALSATLAAGQQAILFLNRRGAATFVMCRDCGYVLRCPRCQVPLTYHSAGEQLVCHHCNSRFSQPKQCPVCFSRRIKHFGAGTQRVEEEVRAGYPAARVVRWDLDTASDARDHAAYLDQFVRGEADVMVGTQMIAKGLDLPRVTLVGVVTADTSLQLPDFRASERTFQLLTQVAGRAGRSILGGKVIVQTYTPEHPAIQAASHHDYEAFYAQEMAFRREQWYPPLSRMVRLLYLSESAPRAEQEARALHALLNERLARLGLRELNLIGPAPAFFARVKGKWRWHILVRGADPLELLRGLTLPLGWRVDVDPMSVL